MLNIFILLESVSCCYSCSCPLCYSNRIGKYYIFAYYIYGRWQGARALLPWIFIHGTDIVDRSLIVLFFGLFCYFSVFFPLPSLPLEIFLQMPLTVLSNSSCFLFAVNPFATSGIIRPDHYYTRILLHQNSFL